MPISNTIWGLDGTYQTEAPWMTKAIDFIPLIETKAKSRLIATGEFAHLIPGHHRAVGKEGVSYIDDFEASKTSIDIKNMGAWRMASIPQGQEDLFPGASLNNNLEIGYKRAKLAWYTIDPLFFRNTSITPPNINKTLIHIHNNDVFTIDTLYATPFIQGHVLFILVEYLKLLSNCKSFSL